MASRWLAVARTVVFQGATLLGFAGLMLAVENAPASPARRTLELQTTRLAGALEQRLEAGLWRLALVGGFVASDDAPEWRAFRQWVAELGEHGERDVLAWAPRVLASGRPEYEGTTGRDAYRSFFVNQLNASGQSVPADFREEHFPLHLVDPLPESDVLLGVDIAAHGEIREAITRAQRSGEPEVLAPLVLEPGGRGERRLVIVFPVFERVRPQEEERALRGVVVSLSPWEEVVAAAQLPRDFADAPKPMRISMQPGSAPEPLDANGEDELGVLRAQAPVWMGHRAYNLRISVPARASLWARIRQ